MKGWPFSKFENQEQFQSINTGKALTAFNGTTITINYFIYSEKKLS